MSRAHTLVGRSAVLLLVASGAVVTGTTPATAAPGGTISGTVSAANRPIDHGRLELFEWNAADQEFDYVTWQAIERDAPKTYSFSVATGRYAVQFLPATGLPGKAAGDAYTLPETLSQPGVFEVVNGGVTQANVVYPAMQSVTGNVRGAKGGEGQTSAYLYRWDASKNEFRYWDGAGTRWQGDYAADYATAGTYTMAFTRPVGNTFETKWLAGNAAAPAAPSGPGVFTIGSSDLVKNFNFDGLTAAPSATTAPAIATTAKVGAPLTAALGTWTETPSYSYQWLRNGVPIAGATGAGYTPTHADAGRHLSVTVTAQQAGNATGAATSNNSSVAKLDSDTSTKAKRKKIELGEKAKLKVDVAGAVAPTGTIKVKEHGKVIAETTLRATDRGRTVVKVKGLDLGTHRLKVKYVGTTAVDGSKKRTRVEVVR